MAVHLQAAGSVDVGRFIQSFGNSLHKVAQQEDIEHACQPGPDQGIEVVHPVEGCRDLEHGQQAYDVGEHAHVHQPPEDGVATGEIQPLVSKGRQGYHDERQQRVGDGDDEAVLHHRQKIRRGVGAGAAYEQLDVVDSGKVLGPQARGVVNGTLQVGKGCNEIRIRLEGVEQQPEDRDDPEEAQRRQENKG